MKILGQLKLEQVKEEIDILGCSVTFDGDYTFIYKDSGLHISVSKGEIIGSLKTTQWK